MMSHFRLILVVVLMIVFAGSISVAAQEITPETTPSATLELTNSYSSTDGKISLKYPESWLIETPSDMFEEDDAFFVNLSTSEDALDKSNFEPLLPDNVKLTIVIGDLSFLVSGLQHPDFHPEQATPEDYVGFAVEIFQSPSIKVSSTKLVEIGDYSGAEVTVDFMNDGQIVHQMHVMSFQLVDKVNVLINLITAPGERDLWMATALVVAQSISYQPNAIRPTLQIIATASPNLTETYTTRNGLTSFRYPEGWLLRDAHGTDADVANTQEALDYGSGATFAAGTLIINVTARTFEPPDSPLQLLQSAYDAGGEGVRAQFDPPLDLRIDDRQAASFAIPTDISDILFVSIEVRSGVIGFVRLTSAPGELERWRHTAYAIAESISYNG